MGKSLSTGKQQTLEWFIKNESKINRILDIGPGSGTYINLIKINNNVCSNAEWVGVEAWPEYIDRFQLNEKYDNVISEDIRNIDWNKLGNFSVAIAGDILEHMSKEDAIVLVEKILTHCSHLIISIPIIHMPQDAINGNPFEIHVKDDWSHDEVMNTWKPYIKDHYRKSGKSKVGVYWLEK
jgi:2-polyprenyl-3-methyl-5-hydroxy-6-metoxy-1,4-benzoquinol methylase